MTGPPRALAGVRVLDLSRLYPGPTCSMILADFGADVLCIEDRRYESEPSLPSAMRGKRHMTLNLKSEEGREIFFRLLGDADVVLEGFRPGVTERLGVDYEALRARNPRIVYASLTGYGQTGPYRDKPGFGRIANAFGGLAFLAGYPDRPPVTPGSATLPDYMSGLFGAFGVLLALRAREKTGRGQVIDIVSSADSAIRPADKKWHAMSALVDRSFYAAQPRRVVPAFFWIPWTGRAVIGHENDDGVVP